MQEPAVILETPTPVEGTPSPPPVEGAPAEPAPETPPEGQGETPEGQEPPPSWEGLEQTEWFPAALEERDKSRDDVLRKEMKREAYREFDPHQQRAEAAFSNALQAGQNMARTLRRLAEDGNWNAAEANRWAEDNGPAWEAMNGSHWAKGVQYIVGQLAAASGDPNVMPAVSVRLNRILFGDSDAQGNVQPVQDTTFLTDFLSRLVEAKTEGMVSKEEAEEIAEKRADRRVKEYKAANAAALQAQQAAGGGPNLAPGSPAGGRSDREVLADPTTPIETIMEIRARQKAGQ